MIVAGVDGGGTGTTLLLCDIQGNVLKKRLFGPFNLNSIGEQRFELLLQEIFAEVVAGGCTAVCIGAAGASNPKVGELTAAAGAAAGFKGLLLLRGDHEIALYGAAGEESGCILIAGTGSVCIGKNREGHTVRVGGWGHLIDDKGSGYSLGRDALLVIAQAEDGRREPTLLKELIYDSLKIRDNQQLIACIHQAPDKSLTASLAKAVETAAGMGDRAAWEIIRQNAKSLAVLVKAVYRQLEVGEGENISLYMMGGLLLHETLLRQEVKRLIQQESPQAVFAEAKAAPAVGAAMIAAREIM